MSDFLTVVKDNALAITTLGGVLTIIGAGIGFWLNFRLSRKKLESDKKALRQQMITNNIAPMRQAWINDVRDKSAELLSDLHLILYSKIKRGKNDTLNDSQHNSVMNLIQGIQYKWSYLNLLLPLPTESNKEEKSSKIINCFEKIMKLTYLPNTEVDKKDVNDSLKECTALLRQLLKEEWEVTKSLKEIE